MPRWDPPLLGFGTLLTFTALSTRLMAVGVLPSVELERVKTAR